MALCVMLLMPLKKIITDSLKHFYYTYNFDDKDNKAIQILGDYVNLLLLITKLKNSNIGGLVPCE